MQKTGDGTSWQRKYSFTLLDNGNPRVTDLKVLFQSADGSGMEPIVRKPKHTIFSNLVYPQDDFAYVGNAGEDGNVSLLAARPPLSAPVSDILDGRVAGSDGVADDFPHNNSDIGFTATVHKDVMSPQTFKVGPGCYLSTISATVKGVAGGLDLPISVVKKVGISAGSCAVPTVTGCTSY
jgi:hypothetical protein